MGRRRRRREGKEKEEGRCSFHGLQQKSVIDKSVDQKAAAPFRHVCFGIQSCFPSFQVLF
jgi:hypothetical protein